MSVIKFGKSQISHEGPCYTIAEIGNNHQGEMSKALEMIKVAAECGADAVKFQKRDNRALYTKVMYDSPYENENSYGPTYGVHRDFLEFGWDEYVELKKYAEECNVEFMSTAFDFPSVDFLEKLDISSYKLASGDLTNIPLIKRVAETQKPIFLSTGAATLEEIELAYNTILGFHDKLCLLHTTCAYPAEYKDLHLNIVATLKEKFPKAIIGYSGHDNGILAASIAYLLGATVVEKHFTLNRAWKGTDHKFSLEPAGLRKQTRDLKRIDEALGNKDKKVLDFETKIRKKMGKAIFLAKDCPAGHVISEEDLLFKSPGDGMPPYMADQLIGKKLLKDLSEETILSLDLVEEQYEHSK